MSAEQARPTPIEVTVLASLDGWPLELHISVPADKLPATLARLGTLGYEPRQQAQGQAHSTTPRRARVEPIEPHYDAQGRPCCPVHKRALTEGRYGLYCPARAAEGEAANDKGYCSLKFVEGI